MSPQSSSLGLIGGDFFKDSTTRSGFRSGIYRPEDNAYIRNYAENIENFYYTGNSFTYPSTSSAPAYLSGIFIKPELDRIYACSGSTQDTNGSVSTDNSIHMNYFGQNGKVSTITSSTTKQVTKWITKNSCSISKTISSIVKIVNIFGIISNKSIIFWTIYSRSKSRS